MTGTPPLRVGAALPDPPFELAADGAEGATGFDVEMMQAVAERLGRRYELVRYTGGDFDGIFAGLDAGDYDIVASGATVTEHRRTLARFCRPYVHSGQSLVVAARRTPPVDSVDDLAGCTLGVQRGNTSEPVAMALRSAGKLGAVRLYDYDSILQALDDVESGVIDGVMKLEPVMRWLTRHRPGLRVAQTAITHEQLAVAVASADTSLTDAVDRALDLLRTDGTLTALGERWLRTDDPSSGTKVVT